MSNLEKTLQEVMEAETLLLEKNHGTVKLINSLDKQAEGYVDSRNILRNIRSLNSKHYEELVKIELELKKQLGLIS